MVPGCEILRFDERVTQIRGRGRPRPRKGGQTTGCRRPFERRPRVSLARPFRTRTGRPRPQMPSNRAVDTRRRFHYATVTICTGYRKPVRFGRGRAAVIGYEPPKAISRKGEKAGARSSREPEDGPDATCGTPSRQRSLSLSSGCFRPSFRSRVRASCVQVRLTLPQEERTKCTR